MYKQLLLPILIFCSLFAFAQKQEKNKPYYYYGSKKVYLQESKEQIYVRLAKNETVNLKSALQKNFKLSKKSFSAGSKEKFMVIKLSENNKTNSQPEILKYIKKNFRADLVRPALKGIEGSEVVIDEEFYVKLKPNTSLAKLNKLILQLGCLMAKKYAYGNKTYLIKATATNGFDGLKMANLFFESGLFEYAEPDFRALDMLHAAPPPPNDPLYNLQWAHLNDGSANQFSGIAGADMDVDEAWAITQGKPAIRIAVIDDGVQRSHPDLVNNIDPLGFGLDASNATTGENLSNLQSHGTSCAGIIAAQANNNIGVAGIAPLCKIIPVNLSIDDSGTFGTNAQIAECIDWAWNQGGADVLSNSYGGGLASSLVHDAIKRATTMGRGGKGAIVLFSSGNADAGLLNPAIFPETIAVGGVSMCNQRKSPASCDGEEFWGANFGVGLDITAPAVKIATTRVTGTGRAPNQDYDLTFNGTSSSCPMVAGVAALVLSVNDQLSFTQVREILERSATKAGTYTYSRVVGQPNGSWNAELGHGVVNAKNAVLAAQNPSFCRVNVAANGNLQVCSGGSVLLQVTNPAIGANYQWRKDETNFATGTTINATQTGKYDVVLTSASGCADTSFAFSVEVAAPMGLLAAHAGKDTAICQGTKTIIGGGPAGTGGTAILHPMRGFGVDTANNQLVRFNPLQPALEYQIISNNIIPNREGGNFFSGSAATPYGLYMISGKDRQFMKIDTATGIAHAIGIASTSTSVLFNGMTYDATTDKIFALASEFGTNKLFEINRITGKATLLVNITGNSMFGNLISLSADNAGTLYALRLASGVNKSAVLYSINKITGVATVIGNTGFQAKFSQGGDVDPITDQLYHFGVTNPIGSGSSSFVGRGLWNLNKTTGLATLVGSIALPSNDFGTLAFASREYKYQWSPASHLSNAQDANPQFTATASGTFTYTLTITDLCGNTATDEVVITVNPAPAAPIITTLDSVLSYKNDYTIVLTAPALAGHTITWVSSDNVITNDGTTNTIAATSTRGFTHPHKAFYTRTADGCNSVFSNTITNTFATGVLISDNVTTVCDTSFYDAGGAFSNTGNRNITKTYSPSNATKKLKLTINRFNIPRFSLMRVYDGSDSNEPQIGGLDPNTPEASKYEFVASNPSGTLTVEYDAAGGSVDFIGGLTCQTPLQFRTIADGIFTNPAIWESRPIGNSTFTLSNRPPNKGDDVIQIFHNVNYNSSVPLDQLIIESSGNLEVTGNRTSLAMYKTIPGNELTIKGIFKANTGTFVGRNSTNILLLGTLINNIQMQTDSVKVFENATAAIISGNGTISKLIVNSSQGVLVNGNVKIERNLSLINGIVKVNAANFVNLIAGLGSKINGGNANSYLEGRLRRQMFSTSNPIIFPLGANGLYRPISLLANQTSSDDAVEYEAEMKTGAAPTRTLPATLTSLNGKYYHTVKIVSGENFFRDGKLTINYGTGDGVTDAPNLKIAKDDGGNNWLNIGGTGTTNLTGSITSNTFTTFGDFVLANTTEEITLPLRLVSFTCSPKFAHNLINWVTENEINTAFFDLEKSTDGVTFASIYKIKAQGYGNSKYQFKDEDYTQNETIYYRLTIVDKDGKFEQKLISTNKNGNINNLTVYPNPVNNQLSMVSSKNIDAVFTNGLGQIVHKQKLKIGLNKLDVSNWITGFYFISTKEESIKFIKQ